MSNYPKRNSPSKRSNLNRLVKVLYSLSAALIIIGLVLVLIIAFIRNGKTEATAAGSKATQSVTTDKEEEGLAAGNQSLDEDKVETVVTGQEARSAVEEDLDTANESQSGSATSWYLITVLTLSTAANGCIALFIFRHNRERIKLLKGKKYVEPEELQKTMRTLSENTKALDKQLSELAQKNADTVQQLVQQAREAFTKVEKNSASHLEDVEELKSAYLLMRDKLDEKDKEIKRYKEGYDTDKLLTSLEGFIKIRDRIASYAEDGKTTKDDLHRLVKIIENTITTSGAKEIEITVGDNIDDDKYLISVSVKREIDTDNPGDDGKIASIEKNGYQITGPEVSTVIRKAEIALHRYKTNK
jgi:hypothetical protein